MRRARVDAWYRKAGYLRGNAFPGEESGFDASVRGAWRSSGGHGQLVDLGPGPGPGASAPRPRSATGSGCRARPRSSRRAWRAACAASSSSAACGSTRTRASAAGSGSGSGGPGQPSVGLITDHGRSSPTRPSSPSTPGPRAGRAIGSACWRGAATWSSPSRSPTGSPSWAGPAASSSATRASRSATSGRPATAGSRSAPASARPASTAASARPSPTIDARSRAWSPTSTTSSRCSRDVRLEDAWGGPIDITGHRFPEIGSRHGGRVHFAHGFAGNGVGSVAPGRAASSRPWSTIPTTRWRALPIVGRRQPLLPPEPFRFIGARLVREALIRHGRRARRRTAPGWSRADPHASAAPARAIGSVTDSVGCEQHPLVDRTVNRARWPDVASAERPRESPRRPDEEEVGRARPTRPAHPPAIGPGVRWLPSAPRRRLMPERLQPARRRAERAARPRVERLRGSRTSGPTSPRRNPTPT